jgi:hypothetical protein
MHQFVHTASKLIMRTTFTLDDDAAEMAKNYAQARSLRLGKAVSELIRQASTPPAALKRKGALWVIAAPPGTPRMSAQQVDELINDVP